LRRALRLGLRLQRKIADCIRRAPTSAYGLTPSA